MRKPLGVWLAGVGVLVLVAGSGAADLCPKCKGKAYVMNIGTCEVCGGPTSSGAFKLCKKCSARLGQCEHCRAPLKAKPPGKPRVKLPAKKILLDEKDSGKTVTAEVDQLLVVRLAGNPTTGYGWKVAKLEGDAVKQVGKIQYVARKVPRGIVGSGGTFVATFRAVKLGKAALAMVYIRPWEKSKPPARTFNVTVQVGPPKPIISKPPVKPALSPKGPGRKIHVHRQ